MIPWHALFPCGFYNGYRSCFYSWFVQLFVPFAKGSIMNTIAHESIVLDNLIMSAELLFWRYFAKGKWT